MANDKGNLSYVIYDEFDRTELMPILEETKEFLEARLKKKGFPKDLKFHICILANHFPDFTTQVMEISNMTPTEKYLTLGESIRTEAEDEVIEATGPPPDDWNGYVKTGEENGHPIYMKKRERY